MTRALLQRGVAHHQIVAVEASLDFVTDLRNQFPQIQIIHEMRSFICTAC